MRPLRQAWVLALSLALISVGMLSTTNRLWSQQKESSSRIVTADEGLPPYSGFGVGYLRLETVVDYADLSDLSRQLGLGDFTGLFGTNLGAVLFTPGVFENVRIGLYAGGGSDRASRRFRLHDSETYVRTLYFDNTVMACGVDYATRIDESFTFFVGAIVGWGHYTVGLSQVRGTGQRFRGLFDTSTFSGDSSSGGKNLARSARIESLHLFLYPSVSLEYVIGSNLMMRLGVGYNTSTRLSAWVDDGGTELEGSPDFNARGPAFALGVFVGLFPR